MSGEEGGDDVGREGFRPFNVDADLSEGPHDAMVRILRAVQETPVRGSRTATVGYADMEAVIVDFGQLRAPPLVSASRQIPIGVDPGIALSQALAQAPAKASAKAPAQAPGQAPSQAASSPRKRRRTKSEELEKALAQCVLLAYYVVSTTYQRKPLVICPDSFGLRFLGEVVIYNNRTNSIRLVFRLYFLLSEAFRMFKIDSVFNFCLSFLNTPMIFVLFYIFSAFLVSFLSERNFERKSWKW